MLYLKKDNCRHGSFLMQIYMYFFRGVVLLTFRVIIEPCIETGLSVDNWGKIHLSSLLQPRMPPLS